MTRASAERAGTRRWAGRISKLGAGTRSVVRTYLTREEGARYQWRTAVASALGVGVPAVVGVALGHVDDGVFAALASWLIMRGNPKGDLRERVVSLVRRALLMTAGIGIGAVTGGWAALPLVALAALCGPLPVIGPFPALCLVIGAQSAGGAGRQALLFLVGTLFGCLLLLLPFFSGRPDPARPRPPRLPLRRRLNGAAADLRGAAREGAPRFRHAVRLCVCVTAAYAVILGTNLAGGQLIIIGVVTTLRPSWGQTTSRIVKRVGGTILGCILAASLLVVASGLSPYALMAMVAVLSGIGMPLRRINYGFWPVFSAPVTLLLTGSGAAIGWTEAVQRSGGNAGGALVAALATLLIWPSHEEDRVPDRLAALIDAHARLLDRASFLAALPQRPEERLGTRAAAEAAARELSGARRRFSLQFRPEAALLSALQATEQAAAGLRSSASSRLAEAYAPDPALSAEFGLLADRLRVAGESLEEDFPGEATVSATAAADRPATAVGELIAQSITAARIALQLRRGELPSGLGHRVAIRGQRPGGRKSYVA